MKKLLSMIVAGSMMLMTASTVVAGPHGMPPPHQNYNGGHGEYHGGNGGYYRGHGRDHHHGNDGWAVAGGILTGVLIGGILQSACYAEPPRREVVYTQPVYQPAPVQYVQPPAPVARPSSDTIAVWVQNSNGSRSLVALRRADNGQYVGPHGEYYAGVPTNEQLRQLYGL